jgi:hypothetical protein
MERHGQYVADQDKPWNFSPTFFARGPLRSLYFIAGTASMGMSLAGVGLILVRYHSQVPTTAVLQLSLAVMGMLALWIRAYITWLRLQEVYAQAEPSPSFVRSPLDAALRNAAAIMVAALYFPFFIVFWLLVGLASVLRGH